MRLLSVLTPYLLRITLSHIYCGRLYFESIGFSSLLILFLRLELLLREKKCQIRWKFNAMCCYMFQVGIDARGLMIWIRKKIDWCRLLGELKRLNYHINTQGINIFIPKSYGNHGYQNRNLNRRIAQSYDLISPKHRLGSH